MGIPTGATGPANGLNAYGGLASNTNQPLTLTASTPVPVTLANQMANKNVNLATNNTITIQNAGDYEITYWVTADVDTAGNVTVEVDNGGTPVTGTSQTLALQNDENALFNGHTIASLEENAALTLTIESSVAGNGNVTGAALLVKQLNANE